MNRPGGAWPLAAAFLLFLAAGESHAAECNPTKPDMLGPFYKSGAPVRSSVGHGYVLHGTVRSSPHCTPVPGATIEFWLAGPEGVYDDEHRATLVSDGSGAYRFESNVPQPYAGRPPHIHLKISAPGFRSLVTQHYPQQGKKEALFDPVLAPSP